MPPRRIDGDIGGADAELLGSDIQTTVYTPQRRDRACGERVARALETMMRTSPLRRRPEDDT
jgi:hypothetical protein